MAFSLRPALLAGLIALGVAAATSVGAGVLDLQQPSWHDLDAAQQQFLAPLSGEWNRLGAHERQQWLGIAVRSAALPTDARARVQRRLADWAKLSPEERNRARERFKPLQTVPDTQRDQLLQNWREYTALPETEKERLRQQTLHAPPSRYLPPVSKPSATLQQQLQQQQQR